MQQNAVSPREINSSIPEALEEIVAHAMEKDPARRYQSAADMIRDIDTFKLDPTVVFGYTDPDFVPDEPEGDTRYYNPLLDNTPPQDDYPDDDYDDDDEDYYDDDDDDDEPRRSYVIPIMLAVTVAVVVIAALVIAWYAVSNFSPMATHSGNVEIPNFVGQNIVQVEQQWKDKLNFDKTEEYSNDYEEGIIMSQSQTGKTVKEGYTLQVTVSKGQRLITVPNMSNKDAEIARSELASAGFTPVLREIYDDNIAKGLVVKTEPEAGTEYPAGKEVQYFVSQGPLETQVKVPNVVGLTQAKAIATLKEAKLDYEVQEIKQDGDKGKVVEQSVKEGEYVDKGTVVTIYISTGEADPITLTMRIPLPNGIRGSYTINVYRDGTIQYTKTIQNAEAVAGGSVSVDITGKKTETLVIYIRSNDLGQENYIRYATYDVNYDKEEITLVGSLNQEDLLKITPAATTPAPPDTSLPDTNVPENPSPDDSSADDSGSDDSDGGVF
ncbi:MAG: PASTA domain-containing protein, partial [Ruminococcus sp.]|nr:PASTA domain-containing protein [Ruminococcus sp.]